MTLFSLTINISIPRPTEKKLSLYRALKHVFMRFDACMSALVRAFVENIISISRQLDFDFLLIAANYDGAQQYHSRTYYIAEVLFFGYR